MKNIHVVQIQNNHPEHVSLEVELPKLAMRKYSEIMTADRCKELFEDIKRMVDHFGFAVYKPATLEELIEQVRTGEIRVEYCNKSDLEPKGDKNELRKTSYFSRKRSDDV